VKAKLFLFSFFFFSVIFYLFFIKPNKTRDVETFIKDFPKKEFQMKLKSYHPKWMNKQIKEDFKDFSDEKSITIDAVDKTYEKILKDAFVHRNAFIRYRIINNKLYRYYHKEGAFTKKETDFEKAIKTLAKLTNLPDVDLIYSDTDGTPEFYMPGDFYILDDKQNQAPILSRAKIIDAKYVVLIPDYYSVSTKWKKDCLGILNLTKKIPWEKKEPLAFWRGGSHDKGYDLENFKKKPRVIISILSKEHPDLIEAGINVTEYMQFKDVLIKENLIKNFASIEHHLKYKYLPVLDGYMCSYPGFQWRLLSNSLCFKQKSNEVQWFYSALKPYKHFIPIENDMSDLVEKINWARNFDDKCKEIAKNATDFVLDNLMLEDVYLYLYKVLKSYSSNQLFDKKKILKDTKNDPNWILIQQRKKANKIILKMKKINKGL